jgi:hypothetical protein
MTVRTTDLPRAHGSGMGVVLVYKAHLDPVSDRRLCVYDRPIDGWARGCRGLSLHCVVR